MESQRMAKNTTIPMTQKEKIDTCYKELVQMVKHWSAEFELTYTDVIGILQYFLVKYINKI